MKSYNKLGRYEVTSHGRELIHEVTELCPTAQEIEVVAPQAGPQSYQFGPTIMPEGGFQF